MISESYSSTSPTVPPMFFCGSKLLLTCGRCVGSLQAFWMENKETVGWRGRWGAGKGEWGEGSKIQLKGYIFSEVQLEFQTSSK